MKKKIREMIKKGRYSVVNEYGRFIIGEDCNKIKEAILNGNLKAKKIDNLKDDNWCTIYIDIKELT